MNIKDKLFALYQYYEKNRKVGHTRLMLNGVTESPSSLVVVPIMAMAQGIKANVESRTGKKLKNKFVSLHGLDGLRGGIAPLAFDNSALYAIFKDAYDYIDHLEGERNEERMLRIIEAEKNLMPAKEKP